jgi:membrane-associated phospholipid phosphatase
VRLRPLEALNLLTLALLSVLTLWLDGRVPDAGGILTRYALMAVGLLLVAAAVRREDRLPFALQFVVHFYPMALIPVLYESLPLILAARPVAKDSLLIAADRALFGTDPTVWLQRTIHPFLTDLFFIAYLAYYFIAIALGIVFWMRDRAVARRFIFTLSLAYVLSYAGYFAVPALGPRSALAARHYVPLDTTAVSRAIASTLDELEHTKFDVFPTGHTMVAVIVMIVAYQRARDTFWWFLPVAISLIVSTVYCRFHYVVDLMAGALLAAIVVPLGDGIYNGWTGRLNSKV